MEKLSKETLAVMSKEELQDAVETLQLKLEVAEKEIAKLREEAEIGRRYREHLLQEALRLIRLVEGDSSPLVTLLEKADIETLKKLVEDYTEKAKNKFKPSAELKQAEQEELLTAETLLKADYQTLLKLREKFINV